MRHAPVFADAKIHLERHRQAQLFPDTFHLLLHQPLRFFQIRVRYFEDEFVVNLEDHFHVRQLVVMQLGMGQCSVERIAHLLRVDRRTIHRRLAQEQQTFSGLVDAVRRELASRYLADHKRTLAEISALLGFAAPSGFSRWYRQQFGTTASVARSERVT